MLQEGTKISKKTGEMKKLTIDIGNTSIKYAIFEDKQMVAHGRTDGHDFSPLAQLRHEADRCIVCSTLKLDADMKQTLIDLCPDTTFMSHLTKIPITNLYQSPQTLGMDRLAAVIGAYSATHSNTLVIDMGTAITYDFVTAKGEYLGGNISPGMQMRFQALHEHTALLPLISAEGEVPEMGYDTETALRSGVVRGIKYEIEGYIRHFQQEYPQISVFLTGGDIKYLDMSPKSSIFVDDFIVPRGLNKILQYNE